MTQRSDFYRATGVDSVAPDPIYDEVQVGFSLAAKEAVVVAIPHGALGVLLTRLAAAAASLPPFPEDRHALAQPMRVQSFQPFSLRDGRKGISFEAQNVDLPLVLSTSQLVDLAKTVAQLLETDPPQPSDLH